MNTNFSIAHVHKVYLHISWRNNHVFVWFLTELTLVRNIILHHILYFTGKYPSLILHLSIYSNNTKIWWLLLLWWLDSLFAYIPQKIITIKMALNPAPSEAPISFQFFHTQQSIKHPFIFYCSSSSPSLHYSPFFLLWMDENLVVLLCWRIQSVI